jgi:3-dehydroquinate dehydratase II
VRILVLNGVNMNILGRRDPEQYGSFTLTELEGKVYEWARELELTVQCRQTNDEGEFIHWCHDAHQTVDGIVINPGAWTHYARSIHDALEPLTIPIAEVHLSNVDEREDWRRVSVIEDVVSTRFVGHGLDGYRMALVYLKEHA